jgi:hypothetical protein
MRCKADLVTVHRVSAVTICFEGGAGLSPRQRFELVHCDVLFGHSPGLFLHLFEEVRNEDQSIHKSGDMCNRKDVDRGTRGSAASP